MQRDTDLKETSNNLVAIREHLKKHDCSDSEHSSKKLDSKGRENRQQEAGSIRHIHDWLNKNAVQTPNTVEGKRKSIVQIPNE